MNRTDILKGGSPAAWDTIDIPEWGGEYLLKPLSGALAEEIQLLVEQAVTLKDFLALRGLRARVTIATIHDMDRQPVFQSGDASALTEQYLPVLQRVFDRVKSSLNFSPEEQEAIEKN